MHEYIHTINTHKIKKTLCDQIVQFLSIYIYISREKKFAQKETLVFPWLPHQPNCGTRIGAHD